MASNNILGIIFSNSFDEAVPQLTALRTMGSVPFAGRYRLIDFALSDMVNAGITKVGILVNKNYRSLMDHIGNGRPWDLARKREGLTLLTPFSIPESGSFKGKVDALYDSISYVSDSGKDYVLLSDSNIITSIDYEDMLKTMIGNNSDAAIAYYHGIAPKLNKRSVLVKDGSKVTDLIINDCYDKEVDYSLESMIIKRTLFEQLLHEAHAAGISDFGELIKKNLFRINITAYEQKGYVFAVDSLQSYFDASMQLLDSRNRDKLFTKDRPIFTKTGDSVPTFYGVNSNVKNSLLADGCKIEGTVENCILFRGVTVAKGAKVSNSILMKGAIVSEGAKIDCVITDKNVVFKQNKTLCGEKDFPIFVGKGIII